jgi:SAM-dependent methyltransferase
MKTRWFIAQWFERRWWKRYTAHKSKEAYLSWKKGYWQELLRSTGLSIPATARVLDAGCGPAGIFITLPTQQVTAIDPLLDYYRREIAVFDETDYPNVTFVNDAIESYGPIVRYDVVCCMNAINHVSDLGQAMQSLCACVVPKGSLLLSVDAHNYSGLKWLFKAIPGDILHPHQLNKEDYLKLVRAEGMEVEQCVRVKRELIFSYWLIIAKRK